MIFDVLLRHQGPLLIAEIKWNLGMDKIWRTLYKWDVQLNYRRYYGLDEYAQPTVYVNVIIDRWLNIDASLAEFC